MHEEGWHVDPYGKHDARWISDGTPTDLVRDSGIVSKDPPPEAAYPGSTSAVVGCFATCWKRNTSSQRPG